MISLRYPAALPRARRRSDRNLAADFDDILTRKPEEVADVHGVSLHRGKQSFLHLGSGPSRRPGERSFHGQRNR